MNPKDYRVKSYETFRERARNPTLSLNEKCGYPEVLRSGQSESIFADIASKLTTLMKSEIRILDIGAGCSDLTHYIIEMTGRHNQFLTVIDSPEMLRLLPNRGPHLTKIAGRFPGGIKSAEKILGSFDAILAYSVAHYVFLDASLFAFIDAAVQLLTKQGQLLLGDIPNAKMRKRFMASEEGKAYHKIHYPRLPEPNVVFNTLSPGEIDDGVLLGLVARMRAAGFHAFVVPQAADLPMANRREDILIIRP